MDDKKKTAAQPEEKDIALDNDQLEQVAGAARGGHHYPPGENE